MNKKILGVDIGRVIIDRDRKDEVILGAFESLTELNLRFNGLVYLVSKADLKTELRTRDWLKLRDFYATTKISPANVYYCRERKEKAPICIWLGITHFVDDRLEVLSHLDSVENKYLFGSQHPEEFEKYKQYLDSVIRVDSWKEILQKIN